MTTYLGRRVGSDPSVAAPRRIFVRQVRFLLAVLYGIGDGIWNATRACGPLVWHTLHVEERLDWLVTAFAAFFYKPTPRDGTSFRLRV
jgi:hypothetical protein